MSRTMTISPFHTRKFLLQTCHPMNMPSSQLPPCSTVSLDLWRQYILTSIRKQLIWRWHTGSPLTQHSRRRGLWHGRTLPNSISLWQFLDGRACSRGICAYLKMPNMISALIHVHTVLNQLNHTQGDAIQYIDLDDLWFAWCYGICCCWWYTKFGWYPGTLKMIQTWNTPVIHCWSRTHSDTSVYNLDV